MSDMRQMKMLRKELLEALVKNLQTHRDTFLKAQEGYREEVVKELDRMLKDAREGKKIKRAISWPEPEDHSSDYEHAIRMLEMCVDEEIEITSEDFQRLVMDDWGWKAHWSDVTANYVRG